MIDVVCQAVNADHVACRRSPHPIRIEHPGIEGDADDGVPIDVGDAVAASHRGRGRDAWRRLSGRRAVQRGDQTGGGGVTGGLLRLTPLEGLQYLWHPAADRFVDLGLSFGAGYTIVGEDEADIKHGMISYTSPIARALIGKDEGDAIEFQAPDVDLLAAAGKAMGEGA